MALFTLNGRVGGGVAPPLALGPGCHPHVERVARPALGERDGNRAVPGVVADLPGERPARPPVPDLHQEQAAAGRHAARPADAQHPPPGAEREPPHGVVRPLGEEHPLGGDGHPLAPRGERAPHQVPQRPLVGAHLAEVVLQLGAEPQGDDVAEAGQEAGGHAHAQPLAALGGGAGVANQGGALAEQQLVAVEVVDDRHAGPVPRAVG